MSDERRIDVSVEIPVTPEQAWEAIATGPGITAWFMPAEVDERVGGSVVHHYGDDLSGSGEVVEYDPPNRFAYRERGEAFLPGDDERVIATEFLVEAVSGGTCVVRVVMSGFGDGDAWDQAIESFTSGWRQALESLRLYLTRFRGEPVASVNVGRIIPGRQILWAELAETLGLPPRPAEGEQVATSASGSPTLSGQVEQFQTSMVTVLADKPGPGIALVGVGGPADDAAFVTVRMQLFGDGAAEVAEREQRAWQAWFADRWSE